MTLNLRRFRPVLALLVALVAPAPAAAQQERAVDVQLTVDRAEGSTRLILTHSRRVAHRIEDTRRRITIHYSAPVNLDPHERHLDGRLVERFRQRDEFTVVLYLGPDFRSHESFELRNPQRLVIDLQGRASRSAIPESRAPHRLPGTIVVIDPGHGGIEDGAIGPTGLREKDVTLWLARRLKSALEMTNPSIGVVLTRDEDRLLGLDERTATANHNKADLFLSIHLNASPRTRATGAETYYLSTEATDDEARILAALENRDAGGSGGGQDGLELILWDLAQNQHLAASASLAQSVQRQLNRLTGTRNRGVRQAPFRVLMGAMMPAILVEVGFISTPGEERRFRDSDYLDRVVRALVVAVQEFLDDLERISGPGSSSPRGAAGP